MNTSNSHFWYPLVRKIVSTPWGATLCSHLLHHLDKPIYQWSNGRTTMSTILAGVPIIKLTTTGAKSGKSRTVPLTCIPKGDDLVLIASNWGGQSHPAWYHNLSAHPQVEVTRDNVTKPYMATEVYGEEREGCWQTAVSIYPGYNAYATRVTDRTIPVIKLSPITNEQS